MLGNYLQRAIDEIRVARSEFPIIGGADVRDLGTVQQALEALLDGLQDIDRRLNSLEKRWCKPKEFGSTSVERVRLRRMEIA